MRKIAARRVNIFCVEYAAALGLLTLLGCRESGGEVETPTDSGMDGDADADADADGDSDADADADADGDGDGDGDGDSDGDGDTDADGDTDGDADGDADIDDDTDSDSDGDGDTDADGDTDGDADGDTDTDTDVDTDTDADGDADVEVTLVIEEETPGFCSVDGVVETINSGFTGAGYANTDNAANTGIVWEVNGVGGPATLSWRYASQPVADRPATLSINGTAAGTVAFPSTGDWTVWSDATATAELSQGVNRVRLTAMGTEGLANIDHLTVTGMGLVPGGCDGDADGDADTDSDADADTDADSDADSDSDADVCSPPTDPGAGHYQMENLDRGVVAVKVSNGVFVSWRMMGYEYDRDNPSNVAYNVYRDGTKAATVAEGTDYQDAAGTTGSKYSISAVIGGTECPTSDPVGVWAENYIRIPLQSPGAYEANDGSPGDLDGDGQYEIVLKWQPNNAQDNSKSGVTDNTYLDGLKLDGTRMWRIDLGPNIRSGAHYTQHTVYDFDGDGKAEVACKTGPGTKDGTGEYLHTGPAANDNDSTVYRNSSGYILSGPEYFTVFDGETGAELATVDYPVPRGNNLKAVWGDDYGNRVDRFNGGFSFVKDGGGAASGRPSIITQRGYYTRLTITAFNWRDGAMNKVWTYDSDVDPGAYGQGNHSLMTADADGDLAMELIPGSSSINSDGTFRCSTKMDHGDALHVGELLVGKGIYVFMPHEGKGGHDCHNAATCEFAFNVTGGDDNGRGVAEYVSTGNTTSASCSSGVGSVNCLNGQGNAPSAGSNFLIYWDGDDVRELLNSNVISKVGAGNLLTASGCSSNNGTKSTPTLTADLLGDWREELVLRETNNAALRVYTTTTPTSRRIYTLMHDPTYRAQVSFEQSSYNQPPHVGFHIGAGMADPPTPNIYVR